MLQFLKSWDLRGSSKKTIVKNLRDKWSSSENVASLCRETGAEALEAGVTRGGWGGGWVGFARG